MTILEMVAWGTRVDVGRQILGEIVSERQESDLRYSETTPGNGILLPDRFPEREVRISSYKFVGSGHGQGMWWYLW